MVMVRYDPQSKTGPASKIFIGITNGNGKAGLMPISLQSKLA